MMRNAYSFTARGACIQSGYDIESLCVFFDIKRHVTALEFFDELSTSLQGVQTLPDCVVVIADESHIATLYGHWTESHGQQSIFQQRGVHKGMPFVKAYYFVGWSANKGLAVVHTHGTNANSSFELPLEVFVDQGLQALVVNNPVVQIAPAGHVFKHPSKTVNKLFIQARELATSEAELAFVGRCLARALPAFGERGLAQVYIDTMGIYSFVREALAFSNSSASVHSFHSYEELTELAPPTEPYGVVISASTSGGMARKLHDDQGFEAERLMTLVDASRAGRHGEVLVALDVVDLAYKKQLADGTETQIELFGEHFSSKAKPPRAVVLGIPHEPKRLNEFLAQLGTNGMLPLNSTSTGSSSSRLVCVNSEVVGRNQKLLGWLSEETSWRVAVAIDHVVHADDVGSKALAEKAAERLHMAKDSIKKPAVIAYAKLDAKALQSAHGVLVVQAVVGDGGLLREISRDLREFLKPEIPRHFLAGIGLPQSDETWLRLQQFLVKNSSTRDYGFSAWLVLPIGSDGTTTAWQAYSDLAANAQLEKRAVVGVEPPVVEQSIQLAVQAVSSAFTGFLPTNSGSSLQLTDGFVFFGKVFKDRLNQIPVCTTYATVASVLQAARELSSPTNQLKPTGYESVAIAPENFLRYNDNLLQACFLRAALPSELDFSSSPHLSRLMKEFLLKLFARQQHAYGAASLEFAAALASGRLRLVANDREEIRKVSIGLLAGTPSALLGLICLIN